MVEPGRRADWVVVRVRERLTPGDVHGASSQRL
jgi:hypothetical protein